MAQFVAAQLAPGVEPPPPPPPPPPPWMASRPAGLRAFIEAMKGDGTLIIERAEAGTADKRRAKIDRAKARLHANIGTTRLYDRQQSRPEDSPAFKVKY